MSRWAVQLKKNREDNTPGWTQIPGTVYTTLRVRVSLWIRPLVFCWAAAPSGHAELGGGGGGAFGIAKEGKQCRHQSMESQPYQAMIRVFLTLQVHGMSLKSPIKVHDIIWLPCGPKTLRGGWEETVWRVCSYAMTFMWFEWKRFPVTSGVWRHCLGGSETPRMWSLARGLQPWVDFESYSLTPLSARWNVWLVSFLLRLPATMRKAMVPSSPLWTLSGTVSQN